MFSDDKEVIGRYGAKSYECIVKRDNIRELLRRFREECEKPTPPHQTDGFNLLRMMREDKANPPNHQNNGQEGDG